jgi:hypothetical protein
VDIRGWFAEAFLPPVLTLVRPHRQIVLLMDDAEALLDAIRAGTLAADSLAYLRQLTDQQPRVHLVLTMDTRYEARLEELSPLVRVNEIVRLANLAPTETMWLLAEPVAGAYSLDDMALLAAQRLTGGEPAFVQALGCALFRSYEKQMLPVRFNAEDIKLLTPGLFHQLEDDLSQTYALLTVSEQQTLRAISQLLYADPLRSASVSAVTEWLADSEDPLDATTVGAALRSLEYREIVTLTPDGIRLTSELMQRWLLEHAYDVPLAVPPDAPNEATPTRALMKRTRGTRLVLVAVLVVMLIVGLLLLSALSSLPRDSFLLPPNEPTVTLPGGS